MNEDERPMAPELDGNGTGYTTLSSTLWRLREVLDQLLFKVFETQLILASGDTRWLARASRELDSALQEVRHVEVMRAVETVAIADALDLPPDLRLAQLERAAPSPWDTIFGEHRDALRQLLADVADTTAGLTVPSPGTKADRPSGSRRRETGATTAAVNPDLEAEVDAEAELVRRFLAHTLANANQASLAAFLA